MMIIMIKQLNQVLVILPSKLHIINKENQNYYIQIHMILIISIIQAILLQTHLKCNKI